MNKHTPGPWSWVLTNQGLHLKSDVQSGYFATLEGACKAAMHFEPEGEANAQLIASAPDLLNAATQALSDLEWIESQDEKTNLQASILLLRAAIDKAEAS